MYPNLPSEQFHFIKTKTYHSIWTQNERYVIYTVRQLLKSFSKILKSMQSLRPNIVLTTYKKGPKVVNQFHVRWNFD